MIKFFFKILILTTTLFLSVSCHRNAEPTQNEQPQEVVLPVSGSYQWKFTIPTMGEQISTHIFGNKEILYKMTGSAYTVEYGMTVESYENTVQKIIAKGKEGSPKSGKFFVIFLKDISSSQVTIYKAEVSDLLAAKNFAKPADNETSNHGWNVYVKQ